MREVVPQPLWTPRPAEVERTHVMTFARQQGFASYDELRRLSVDRRADFWKAVVVELGIIFRDEGSVVLDGSKGPQRARWWPDASMNIVESCFQHPPDRRAAIYRRRGALSSLSYGDLHRRIDSRKLLGRRDSAATAHCRRRERAHPGRHHP